MRAQEFTIEEKEFNVIQNPFPKSRIKQVVYHGTTAKFDKFERAVHGVFISRYEDYVEIYGGKAIPLYIDLRNIFDADWDHPAVEAAFDVEYGILANELAKLKQQGYDAVEMGGDGDSLILIGNVPIVNAVTGEQM